MTLVDSTFSTKRSTSLMSGLRSTNPSKTNGRANSTSTPISIQKSPWYTPNMAARMALTACVIGKNGLAAWKKSGSSAKG